MKIHNFLAELKRRNVYKVAITYAVVTWLLIQAASILLPTFDAPPWVMKTLVVLLGLGFGLVVFISWAFEATPEGLKRTEEVSADEIKRLPTWSRRKFVTFVIGVALIATGLLAYQFLRPRTAAMPRSSEMAADSTVASTVPQKSIAVLPFDNLSEDKNNAYFAEGVQDEILTRLAKVADLKVISRTSTQKYKSAPENLREIAKQLGVASILEGSVQKAGDQVRVNVQLINAMNDGHLWADIYDRKVTDIFAAESEIAKTIADTLRAKLTGSEVAAMAKAPTANSEAYEVYLKGRYFWNKRTGADLRKAIDYFNQAISKDPNYALAYVGLADSYLLLSNYGAAAPKDSIPQAKAAVKKALELDSNLAETHASAAILAGNDFHFEQSISEFERSIQLSPNYATAHHWFGDGPLMTLGRFERAVSEGKRSVELDPLALINNADLGWIYINARRYDEAVAQLRKTIEIDPRFYLARYYLGQALQLKGQLKEGIGEYRVAVELNDDPIALAFLGQAYARAGEKAEAQKILARLTEGAKSHYVSQYSFALVLVALGDKEAASMRWSGPTEMKKMPTFPPLESTLLWTICAAIPVSKRWPRKFFRQASSTRRPRI